MTVICNPAFMMDEGVVRAIKAFNDLVGKTPTHCSYPARNFTALVIVGYFNDGADAMIYDGAYVSYGGRDISDPNPSQTIVELLDNLPVAGQEIEAWERRTPDVLSAFSELVVEIGNFNRATMNEQLVAAIPTQESGLPPLLYLNNRDWQGTKREFVGLATSLLNQPQA